MTAWATCADRVIAVHLYREALSWGLNVRIYLEHGDEPVDITQELIG